MNVLLDTNAYTELRRGHEGVATIVRRSEGASMSVVVVAELMYGFRSGNRLRENLEQLHAFLDSPFVILLPVTMATADRYSRITSALRAKGRPIPTNDIWIAAHAMETGADLVTFDHHFEHVDGLAVVEVA